MMGTGAAYDVDRVGVFTPEADARPTNSGPARSASSPPRSRRWPTPASATPSRTTASRSRAALPGFRPSIPVVFCGLFPVDAAQFEDLRAAMGKLRLNDASFTYEMETERRARLRLPLRLPRAPASRDHPGAAGARVQPRPDRDRAVGDLQDQAEQRERRSRSTIRSTCRTRCYDQGDRGAVDRGHHPDAGRISRHGAEALPGPPRHPGRAHLRGQPRDGEIRPAAQRGGVRFLRPAQVGVEGLCLVRLSPHRLQAGRSREDADAGQRRAGRCARHAGAPHARREAAAAPWRRSSRS